MYLQFACNVTAMGNDGMDGEVEFVGDGFVGHTFHNAGDNFLFTLTERLLLIFFLLFFGYRLVRTSFGL